MKIIIIATALICLAAGANAQSLNDTIRRQEWQQYQQQQQRWQQDMLHQQQMQQSNQLMLDTTGRCNLAIAMGTTC
jgi:hypothetical protein